MATDLARVKNVNALADYARRTQSALSRERSLKKSRAAEAVETVETLAGGAIGGAADALITNALGEDNEAAGFIVPGVALLGLAAGIAGPRFVPGAKHIAATSKGIAAFSLGDFVRNQVEDALEG